MNDRPLRRVYRVRALTASILCLPALLIALWYSWNAYERFSVAKRIEDEHVELTVETFQILLHDLLTRDRRRITMSRPPEPSKLDVFTFHINQEDLDVLQGGERRSSGREYANAKLEFQDRVEDAELRLRGQRYWHMGTDQKSVKVRLPKGKLLKGYRVFNLINDPSPMVVGEHLVLELARQRGILTPRSGFARVRMNATDMGVFHYETQPDESLLRTSRRVPGSIYSGDLPAEGDSWELWKSITPWKKPAAKTDDEVAKTDMRELEHLLKEVNDATHAEFADFVEHEVDLEKFAVFDAIDVAFGGERHNFRQNQKYAFDPYTGRFEPIAWSFEGFRDDPNFNLVDHPLLVRFKLTPGYLTLRDKRLYELLVGEASFPTLEQHGASMLAELAPELRTDPFWDAYHMLSRIDSYHRQMVRPMTISRAVLVFESELTTYQQRSRRLLQELVKNPLYGRWQPLPDAPAEVDGAQQALPKPVAPPVQATPTAAKLANKPAAEAQEALRPTKRTALDLVIDGRVGVRLERILVKLPDDCPEAALRLLRGTEVVAEAEHSHRLDLQQPLDLFPTVSIVERDDPGSTEGPIRTALTPEKYSLVLESTCAPRDVEAQAIHLATGTRVTSQPATDELISRVPVERSRPDTKVRFQPGEVAPHAWDLAMPKPELIQLGPGEVSVQGTRVFDRYQRVEVAAGTRFKMAAGASLVFLGKVEFNGTRALPIVLERVDGKPWGGIALQGKATEGSRFSYVQASGGTTPKYRAVTYPALLNIHDTKNITIQHCHFRENVGTGDMVHVVYVEGLVVEDSRISDVARDAWDLEFTQATMSRASIANAGDDAIDLMGTKLTVADSIVVGARGNGISSGEESEVLLRQSIVAETKVGVLAKNASSVDLFGTVLFRNQTGIRVYERTVRYEGESQVKADVLFAIQTEKKVVKRDDKKKNALDYGRARSGFPPPGVLDSLLRDVIRVGSWQELDTWAKAQRGSVL